VAPNAWVIVTGNPGAAALDCGVGAEGVAPPQAARTATATPAVTATATARTRSRHGRQPASIMFSAFGSAHRWQLGAGSESGEAYLTRGALVKVRAAATGSGLAARRRH
jgi:hypothetical protein